MFPVNRNQRFITVLIFTLNAALSFSHPTSKGTKQSNRRGPAMAIIRGSGRGASVRDEMKILELINAQAILTILFPRATLQVLRLGSMTFKGNKFKTDKRKYFLKGSN